MKYNKLNIFYLALPEKELFRLPFELSFERFSLEAWLPASVQENEPTFKSKINFLKQVFKLKAQEMEYTVR